MRCAGSSPADLDSPDCHHWADSWAPSAVQSAGLLCYGIAWLHMQ